MKKWFVRRITENENGDELSVEEIKRFESFEDACEYTKRLAEESVKISKTMITKSRLVQGLPNLRRRYYYKVSEW